MHMRIGLMTTSFPRDERDIAGTFVLGFSRALAELGHRIEVLAPEPREPVRVPSWPGVRVQHVPYLRPRSLQRTFYAAGVPDNLARDPLAWLGLAPFSAALLIAAARRRHGWDALISHWALPCALAAGAVRQQRAHLAVLHSADVHLLGQLPGRRLLARRIAQGADALWFVTEQHRQSFLSWLGDARPPPRTLVCPMGVELPDPAGAAPVLRSQTRRRHQLQGFCVLALSRLVPIKGLDTAIAAAAAARVTLLIAGEGPERARLARLARELHADVRFLGKLVGEDKSRLMHAVDAFVLPSRNLPDGRSEGLPTALLEALAHGLPVVASRLAGARELLEPSELSRWLVPAGDVAALAAALRALRDSPTLAAASSHAAATLARNYTWPRIAARAHALLT
jgi:glycosyltransferase involved in cell wall biosynthesis